MEDKAHEILIEAEMQPLQGKYYGTVVKVLGRDIKIWLTHSSDDIDLCSTPSDRELAEENITRLQWVNNSEVETHDAIGGNIIKVHARDLIEACDHYEDQLSFLVAQHIEKLLNENPLKLNGIK